MNTDIRIQVTFFSHPKIIKLEHRLGKESPLRLIQLWTWVAQNKPDGNLVGMLDEDIEIAAGANSGFVKNLLDLKLLDGPKGKRVIHDWIEHNPWAADAPLRSARAKLSALTGHHDKTTAVGMLSLAERTLLFADGKLNAGEMDTPILSLPLLPPPSLPKKTLPIESEFDVALIDFVNEILPGNKSDAQLRKQVDALDKLIRIDREKVCPEMKPDVWRAEVIAVLRYMRADTEPRGDFPGWSKVFNSIPRLRANGCEKYQNARGWYLARKPTTNPQTVEARIAELRSRIKIAHTKLKRTDPDREFDPGWVDLDNMKRELGKLEKK